MNLLRILALLGKNDQASSEGMYEVLVDVMKRADTGINIGYAIGKGGAAAVAVYLYIVWYRSENFVLPYIHLLPLLPLLLIYKLY